MMSVADKLSKHYLYNWLKSSKVNVKFGGTRFLDKLHRAKWSNPVENCYICKCLSSWTPFPVTISLQKLQNRAARVLTFSNYDADATELLEFLRWKNLTRQQEIHKATMMFRCLHGLAPEYLCSKFTWRDSAYDLRDSENKLNVPLPRTNYYRKSFSYSGATLWNSLPCDIRNTESLGLFKRKINATL